MIDGQDRTTAERLIEYKSIRDEIERGMQIAKAAIKKKKREKSDLLPLLTGNRYDLFIFILQFNS